MWKSNRRQHKRKLAIHLKVSYCPVLAKPNLHATQNYLKLAQFGWDWLRLAQLCVKKVRLHHITGFSPTELRWVRCELCLLSTSTVVRWRAGQAGHSVRTAAVLSNIEHQHQHREQCLHRLSISNSRVQIHIHGRPTLADCRAMSFVQIQNWINLPFYTLTPARESAECR